MKQTVLQQIDALDGMSMEALRQRWRDLFGTDPGRLCRSHLVRRLAYRIQELAYGGLGRDARIQLKAIAEGKGAVAAGKRKTTLAPGTRLLREWRGDTYEVIVRPGGFECSGAFYRSLSAVANAITEAHWNGNQFFGLDSPKRKKEETR